MGARSKTTCCRCGMGDGAVIVDVIAYFVSKDRQSP
jgi:hypothetical protein